MYRVIGPRNTRARSACQELEEVYGKQQLGVPVRPFPVCEGTGTRAQPGKPLLPKSELPVLLKRSLGLCLWEFVPLSISQL